MTALIDQVGTQLGTGLTNFATVALAWTSTPIADFDNELPAALYYLDSNASEPSSYSNRVIQTTEHGIAVLIVCPVADLTTRFSEVRAALVEWQPTGDSWGMCEHVRGETLQINQGLVWWRELFAVENYAGDA